MAPNSEDLLAMGDIFYEDKEYEGAKKILAMALGTKKSLGDIYYKTGLIFKDQGEEGKARVEFEKGLAIEPDSEDIKEELKKLGVKVDDLI